MLIDFLTCVVPRSTLERHEDWSAALAAAAATLLFNRQNDVTVRCCSRAVMGAVQGQVGWIGAAVEPEVPHFPSHSL